MWNKTAHSLIIQVVEYVLPPIIYSMKGMILRKRLSFPSLLGCPRLGSICPKRMVCRQSQRQKSQRRHIQASIIGIIIGYIRLFTIKSQRKISFFIEITVSSEHTPNNSRHSRAHLSGRQAFRQPATLCQHGKRLQDSRTICDGTSVHRKSTFR